MTKPGFYELLTDPNNGDIRLGRPLQPYRLRTLDTGTHIGFHSHIGDASNDKIRHARQRGGLLQVIHGKREGLLLRSDTPVIHVTDKHEPDPTIALEYVVQLAKLLPGPGIKGRMEGMPGAKGKRRAAKVTWLRSPKEQARLQHRTQPKRRRPFG